MNKKIAYTLIIFILSIVSISAQKNGEWITLFDGKTLNGWEQRGGNAKYEVVSGAIVGTTAPDTPNSFLCTKKDYGNFILELEFWVDPHLNSGIQFRSRSNPEFKNGLVYGYQFEIDPEVDKMYTQLPPNYDEKGNVVSSGKAPRSWTGGIYDERRRGWIGDLTHNPEARKAFKPNQWNKVRIEAIHDGLKTFINDVPAANIVDFMNPTGFIALQVHAVPEYKEMHVKWKNIRIMDLGMNQDIPEEKDSLLSEWKDEKSGYVAQIYKTGDIYKINLTDKPFTTEKPMAVLEGSKSGEDMLFSNEEGWSGKIEKNRLHLTDGKTKFEGYRLIRRSPSLNQLPPANAIILFDGTNLEQWAKHKPKQWLEPDGEADNCKLMPCGAIELEPGKGSIITKNVYGDYFLHIEYRLLGKKTNGGVYFSSRYELNISDSYGQIGGSPCGTLGNVVKPDHPTPTVNNALPPGEWQTMDVEFRSPRFDDTGKKTENARITSYINGELMYKDIEVEELKGAAGRFGEASLGPIYLQEHGTAYQFRNIWIIEKK